MRWTWTTHVFSKMLPPLVTAGVNLTNCPFKVRSLISCIQQLKSDRMRAIKHLGPKSKCCSYIVHLLNMTFLEMFHRRQKKKKKDTFGTEPLSYSLDSQGTNSEESGVTMTQKASPDDEKEEERER